MNIFGAFGALGRLLPGYVQGHRNAVQDNWNDLNQYNQVQGGQLANAFNEGTFEPRMRNVYNQALQNHFLAQQAAWAQPGTLSGLAAAYPYQGALAQMMMQAQMRALGQMGRGQPQQMVPGPQTSPQEWVPFNDPNNPNYWSTRFGGAGFPIQPSVVPPAEETAPPEDYNFGTGWF